MKYSIIVVGYKAADQLIKCLKSLTATPPASGPYTSKADAEIILVDNSPDSLDRQIPKDVFIRLCQTYVRYHVICKPENIGFAAACNEGVAASSGQYVVLVNPDTEVFPGWAERMAAHFNDNVGAVGPISNFVAGFQRVDYHSQIAPDWVKTARNAARGNNLRGVETKLLIGFFMMIPRAVWDKVGGMDPQFFLGCDDLDISMRIREAGYQLIIASDVFVYHEGHASFYAAGSKALEYNKQSEKKMFAKLQAKYGDKIPTSTELWGCEILPTYTPKRQTLSVCMIVKNEGDNLKAILPQLGFADEIVMVDTETSLEERVYLGNGFTAHLPTMVMTDRDSTPNRRLYHFPWTDSFAEARNFALSKCTGDWVLWLDADDRVSPESAALIRAALDNPGPRTQAKTCHFGFTLRDDGPDGFNYADGQPRLFPRVPGLEWEGRVHESYMDAAARLGIEKVDAPNIIIDHTGYKDPAVMLKKHSRNLRLMRMEIDSPKKFYHMGKNLMALGHFIEAEDCFRNCLEIAWAAPLETVFRDQVRTCMASLIILTKGPDRSVDAYLEDNAKPDSLMLRAEVAFFRGKAHMAERLYQDYLALEPYQDPHGGQQDYFRRVAGERLEAIGKIKEKVFAGVA